MMASQTLVVITTYILGVLIDALTNDLTRNQISSLLYFLIGTIVLSGLFDITARINNAVVLQKVRRNTKQDFINRLLSGLSNDLSDEIKDPGKIDGVINIASFACRSIYGESFVSFLTIMPVIITTTVLYATYGIEFFAVIVISIIGIVLLSYSLAKRNKKYVVKAVAETGKVSSILIDQLSNMAIIRNYGTVDYEKHVSSDGLNREYEIYTKTQLRTEAFYGLQRAYSLLGMAVLISYAYQQFSNAEISLGVFVFLVSNMLFIIRIIDGVGDKILAFVEFKDRFIASFDQMSFSENSDRYGYASSTGDVTCGKESSLLSMSGIDVIRDNRTVLKDIDLDIDASDRIIITGKSGIGKSTLGKVLAGIITPHSGNVFRLKSTLDVLYINQNESVFNRSIQENIAYASTIVDTERLKRSMQLCNLHEYVGKEDYIVGIRGGRLSGGEIQRIVIARSLYRGADIAIYDEVTSNLDNKNKECVIKNIINNNTESAYIFITHDKELTKYATKSYNLTSEGLLPF